MRSSNIAYLPRVDHLRCLAAGLVFLFHLFHMVYGHWQPYPQAWAYGWIVEGQTGVGLFFVLSGYLFMTIALVHGGRISYGQFMRNRFLRIFPLFLFVFFISISMSRDQFQAADWAYVFFSNIGRAPTSNQFITGAAWTISVEFTFYLIFPFIARFTLENGYKYLLRLIVLIALFKLGAYFSVENPKHMYYSTVLGRLDQFLVGMVAALISVRLTSVNKQLHTAWLAAAMIAVWGSLAMQSHWFSYFSNDQKPVFWIYWGNLEAICWAFLIIGYSHWRGRLPLPIERLLEAGGKVSFSIYLWHALIIFLWVKLTGHVDWTGVWQLDFICQAAVLGMVTWMVANLSYETIEEPFLNLRRRY